MRKLYLKDMSEKQLAKLNLQKTNPKLRESVIERVYEINMLQQQDFGEELLGDSRKFCEIKDHYYSFYLQLTDRIKFSERVEEKIDEYEIYFKEKIEKFKELVKLRKEYNLLDLYNEEEKRDDIDEKGAKLGVECLSMVEKFLHNFENVENENIIEYLSADENYFIKDDTYTVYYHRKAQYIPAADVLA